MVRIRYTADVNNGYYTRTAGTEATVHPGDAAQLVRDGLAVRVEAAPVAEPTDIIGDAPAAATLPGKRGRKAKGK